MRLHGNYHPCWLRPCKPAVGSGETCYLYGLMATPVSSSPLSFGHTRIKTVSSLHELVTMPFRDGINALCWPRTLPSNFREVIEALPAGEGIVPVDEDQLASLTLSEAGNVARDILLADLASLRAHDLQPELDCVHASEREAPEGLFHTDVASWHVDTATVPADTYLCTYVGACSEGLPNEQARRRVDVPETRAELLRLYGGEDDAGFREYLAGWFYDLHYIPLPQARPFSFGVGNLWRIAIAHPGSRVLPCVHRAPLTLPGQPARLLLIS